jgi:hypothetical protein
VEMTSARTQYRRQTKWLLPSAGPEDDEASTIPQQQSAVDVSNAEAFFSSDRPSWSRSVIFLSIAFEDFDFDYLFCFIIFFCFFVFF